MKTKDDKTTNCDDQIRFEKVPCCDWHGDFTESIDGEFDCESLAGILIEKWVPYSECQRRCYASSSCRFALKSESQCGLKSEVIKNYIHLTVDFFKNGSAFQQKALLAGAYNLAAYVGQSTFDIALMANKTNLDYWGNLQPCDFLSQIVNHREHLNNMAQFLCVVPGVFSNKPILLVEGKSEKAFLCKLRESHYAWFSKLRIEVYGGKGNRIPKRIQMRLDKYVEDGYVCFMQGDRDGSNKEQFEGLINNGTVKRENVFEFEFDFETSIPPKLLFKTLQDLDCLKEVDRDSFIKHCEDSRPIGKMLKEIYSFDIDPIKIDLAEELGWIFAVSDFRWYQDVDKFLENTELGRFLDFVIKMNCLTCPDVSPKT